MNHLMLFSQAAKQTPNKIYIDGSDMQPYVYKDGKFVKFKGTEFDTLGYRYYSIDKNGANIKNIHAEHIAYDEDTESIYLAYIFPTSLLVKIDDFKVTKYANYTMIYDRSDSPMVIIGEKLYALFNNSASSSFIRRIDKYTLQEELSMSYDGIIDGNAGCGLYKINDELYLRGKDNKLYNVNKDDLTLSETGIENIQCICNFRLDTIAYTDGTNAYLYNGEITNTKQLPENYTDLYFINTYRARDKDNIFYYECDYLRWRARYTTCLLFLFRINLLQEGLQYPFLCQIMTFLRYCSRFSYQLILWQLR